MDIFLAIGISGWIALALSIFIYYRGNKNRGLLRGSSSNENTDPKVVVIGGGTGQSVFLRGLKLYTKNITAIVTVADDGGGSGVLREDLGMLPPGDIRNCLLALANIEPTMNEVMNYRFTEGALKGQSFGNLFLAAMNGLYGNFETAVYKMSEIFAITGRVLPVTLEDVNLVATLQNGDVVRGESAIPKEAKNNNSPIEKISLDPKSVKPLSEVIKSINEADIIVIGPGSLYTSILPNLLVDGVVDAIKSSGAPKVYVSNIMTQPGETDNFNVYDHLDVLTKYTGGNIIDIVISNNEILPIDVLDKYQKDGAEQVVLDKLQKEKLYNMGAISIESNLVDVKKNYIRHNAERISKIVVNLALSHDYNDDNY